MNRSSRAIIYGSPALLLLLLLLVGPWNSLPSDSEPVADLPLNPDNTSNDLGGESTESNDVQEQVPTTSDAVEQQDAPSMPSSGQEEPTFVTDSIITSATSNSGDASETEETQNTGITVSSRGGGGHRSSHSNADDSQNSNEVNQNDSEVDVGASSNDDDTQTGDPDGSTSQQDDESFFVLPESPVGVIAMMFSAMAALGGYLYLRSHRAISW